ncbi:MAG: PTS sugar transporter subunit IIA [Spirochaetaceae bacterium]|jgi:PTS system nitrogen regulatory IIA component|nr:PTS sugar transporter subunit IIA [Spirochaetaceae bacterium]
MENTCSVYELIHNGEVIHGITEDTTEKIYWDICQCVVLPENLKPEKLYTELCQREELMSTAIGHGIALPHPRFSLLEKKENQRIFVGFLETPILMSSPDALPVYAFFLLLTSNPQCHRSNLAELAKLFQKDAFRAILETKPEKTVLLEAVKKYTQG